MDSYSTQNNTRSVQQQSIPIPTSGLEVLFATWGLTMLIGFLIFILWIWSMISMISLSGRFKDFLDEYRMNQYREAKESPSITAEDDSSTEKLSGTHVEDSISGGELDAVQKPKMAAIDSLNLSEISKTSKILLGVAGVLVVVLLIVLQVYR